MSVGLEILVDHFKICTIFGLKGENDDICPANPHNESPLRSEHWLKSEIVYLDRIGIIK